VAYEPAATAGASGREVLEAVEVGIEMGGGPATVSARFALTVMAAVFADGPKDGAGGLAAAGPILAPARATAVRPAGGGEEFQRRRPPRFVPNGRPVPVIHRRAALRVTAVQVIARPRGRVRALPASTFRGANRAS
jgi:hypothetical protein